MWRSNSIQVNCKGHPLRNRCEFNNPVGSHLQNTFIFAYIHWNSKGSPLQNCCVCYEIQWTSKRTISAHFIKTIEILRGSPCKIEVLWVAVWGCVAQPSWGLWLRWRFGLCPGGLWVRCAVFLGSLGASKSSPKHPKISQSPPGHIPKVKPKHDLHFVISLHSNIHLDSNKLHGILLNSFVFWQGGPSRF